MSMKLTHAFAAATTAATLTLAPAVAHADSYSQTDASGDVAGSPRSSSSEEFTVDPARANGDVTTSRITHLARKVRIKLTHRDLSRTNRFASSLSIRSNTGLRYVFVEARKGSWAGKHGIENARGTNVSCSGLAHKIDYVANTVLIVIPRSCLGNPRWVRVSMGTYSLTSTSVYADDARVTGDPLRDNTYTPRIYQ